MPRRPARAVPCAKWPARSTRTAFITRTSFFFWSATSAGAGFVHADSNVSALYHTRWPFATVAFCDHAVSSSHASKSASKATSCSVCCRASPDTTRNAGGTRGGRALGPIQGEPSISLSALLPLLTAARFAPCGLSSARTDPAGGPASPRPPAGPCSSPSLPRPAWGRRSSSRVPALRPLRCSAASACCRPFAGAAPAPHSSSAPAPSSCPAASGRGCAPPSSTPRPSASAASSPRPLPPPCPPSAGFCRCSKRFPRASASSPAAAPRRATRATTPASDCGAPRGKCTFQKHARHCDGFFTSFTARHG
eukprot:5400541-Pyramimonas_sp.AAC.1